MTSPSKEPLLTLKTGGWVLLIAGAVCIALIAWALTPALLTERPPGDGRNVDTYGFDLSTLLVPRETLVPIMRHRDMVPVMHEPRIIEGEDVARINEEERGKYLVSRDRIVGVVVGGEARAYPVNVLTVHEVVHDTLGGVPIAVTYNWPGDAVRVFDRRLGSEVLTFGISGLASNANGLLYDIREQPDAAPDERSEEDADGRAKGAESLWSQLTGRAIAGPAAEARLRLTTIPAQLTSWSQWLELHPETSVIAREPQLARRYRKATPDDYFRSPLLPPFPIDPVPEQHELLKWKDRVIVIDAGDQERRVYPLRMIRERAMGEGGEQGTGDRGPGLEAAPRRGTFTDELGPVQLRFTYDADSNTAYVEHDPPDHDVDIVHAFWFAWHAAERTLFD